jgi:hypothetical protein
MKNRKTIILSVASFLILLLILGQQEIKKAENVMRDLTEIEIDNFIFTSHSFAKIIKSEATPLIAIMESGSIDQLLISKCQLKENIFVRQVSGQEIVCNCYGDAGIIQYELERGGKIITANQQKEFDYFKKNAIPIFKMDSFSSWQIFFYFFKNTLLLLVFTALPFFFSIKLFLLFMGALIIVLSLISVREITKNIKLTDGTAKEYFLKKPPPNLGGDIGFHQILLIKEGIIQNKPEAVEEVLIKIISFEELNEKTRKALNKIFHVPKYVFA